MSLPSIAPNPVQPRASRRSPSRRAARVPRSTLALLAISVLLPLMLFGLAAYHNRREVVTAAERRVERTTRILHEHAMKVFETHQLMLDQINEHLPGVDWTKAGDVAALRGLLVHISQLLPQVADISVMDADGKLLVSSALPPGEEAPNFADRDYFRALKAAPSSLPYVSRGAMGRLSGTPIFIMAERMEGKSPGRFEGVVAVSIEQSSFKEFYSQTARESHLVILARSDGGVLASEPMLPAAVTPPAAMFQLAFDGQGRDALVRPALVDGVRRIFGYEKVGRYPVIIGFGITWQSALLPWWRNMWGYGFVAALSSLALLGVSGFAIRRIALEGRATERWRRTAAQLRTEMAERARVEEQLRQSQKMDAVGRLTGGIAHDFNNLLTVVIGSLDLLGRRMKDADPRHRELVANAVDGASRAAALTQRLLAFSRQQPLEPKPLAINGLIEGMRSLLDRTLRESVTIELKLDAAADDRVLVDPNQLENAVLNLCVNAMDAMPRGGTLTVSTTEVELDVGYCAGQEKLEPGAYVAIAVLDTGTGMPPAVLARAFEPFFTTKPVGKGTGLGLAQVYGFARQSGGHADIMTKEGAGTAIRILLPRLRSASEAVADNVVPMAAAPPPPPRQALDGRKVLLVEDDDGVRHFAAGTLRDAGYEVVEASTGPDALRELAAHADVALLFTDVVLKGPMTGRDLAEAALLARPGLPVLYTTGYAADVIIHDGRLDEGLALIGKPFRAEALIARVETMLPERDASRALRSAVAG